uniref:Putative 3-hydroxyisobutyryl-CoA hydrolase 2 n=1 Tax=Rhizophora mucronata TaxID=61149 RepID=A0A2P2Q2V3_RHIMU
MIAAVLQILQNNTVFTRITNIFCAFCYETYIFNLLQIYSPRTYFNQGKLMMPVNLANA